MTVKEHVARALESLDPTELFQVADYVEFLKFRREKPHPADEERLAALYAEFEAEDRQLAELGMEDYAEHLAREDGV